MRAFSTITVLIVCGFLLLPYAASAAVTINEVAWMGSPPQAGETATQAANNEWMELANDGGAVVDLTGWRLDAADGTPSIALTGSVSAGGFFLLERTDDGTVPGVTADLIYTGALSNSGETLVLKDASGTVAYTIDASGGWPAGDNTTKDTMQRTGSGWITAAPTPRAVNAGGSTPPPALPLPTAAPVPAPPAPSHVEGPPAPSLGADAGPDISALAGAVVQFEGLAFGLDGKPFDPAGGGIRYFWNFGDGSTQEKRSPTHIFHFPGIYSVNLSVQSGYYAGSDWRTVTVFPAELAISEVKPGGDGFIELSNKSAVRVDLGGMFLTDDQKMVFRIPFGTVVGPKNAVVFPAVNTRLAPVSYLNLRDARGVLLDEAKFSGAIPATASWERAGTEFHSQQMPTPGKIGEDKINPPTFSQGIREGGGINGRAPAPPPRITEGTAPPLSPSQLSVPESSEGKPAVTSPGIASGTADRGTFAAAANAFSTRVFLTISTGLGLAAALGILWLKRIMP